VRHADNAKLRVSKQIQQFMEVHEIRTAPHPPYSPGFGPRDFFVSGHLTRTRQRSGFNSAEELLDATVEIVSVTSLETLLAIFHKWIDRLQVCIDGEGEHVE
jgi:hypothetical protein